MEVFGARWQDYTARLKNNWNNVVEIDDTVIVPGDISWGMTTEEALPDLLLLNSLNGKKIIGKGNHDFWWTTQTKLYKTLKENRIDTINFLYNNAHITENFIIAGTRGWYNEATSGITENRPDYQKIINREAIRLRISLEEARKLRCDSEIPIIVFFHFPPVWNGNVCRELVDLLGEYDIKKCYFGHIHGNYGVDRTILFENVTYELISSDFLNFTPIPIRI